MSKNRVRQGAELTPLEYGPNGRALCRQCKTEVKPPRQTFCGEQCVEAWRMTTSPGFVRAQLSKRDKGVCAICGLDTLALKRAITLLRGLTHPRYADDGGRDRLVELVPWLNGLEQALGIRWSGRSSLWDADHIVEVVRGGGECGLENYQTLCLWCHRAKTARLARELAAERAQAKEAGQLRLPEEAR